LKTGKGVRYTKSQDLEACHERFAAFCRAGGYHDACGWGGGGIELDAVARGVLDDAAGCGWADWPEDGIGVRDGAGGAGVFDDAVRQRREDGGPPEGGRYGFCVARAAAHDLAESEEHRQECLCYWISSEEDRQECLSYWERKGVTRWWH
jgi:hypothetical protein